MSSRPNKISLMSAALFSLLSACATVSVHSPSDRPGQLTGSVTPLKEILANNTEPVILVFVHGVGDYCRGYAVGDQNAKQPDQDVWLNSDAMQAIGLSPVSGSQQDVQITAEELGIGGPLDTDTNLVLLRERDYRWEISRSGNPILVHAVEVTWSPMTRWIKNSLLGYDGTTAVIPIFGGSSGITTCSNDTTDDSIGQQTPNDPWFSPPPRAVVNGYLKWSVLDRDLADAMIYAGTYSEAMQRGIAAALCRVASGREDNGTPCMWPAPSSMPPSHFIFVTHSLGSRLLYDTLLKLTNPQSSSSYPACHLLSYRKNWATEAPPDVGNMIADTAGFYMMANQVTMLGLAHVPVDAPINLPQPFAFPLPGATPTPNSRQNTAAVSDPLVKLLHYRSEVLTQRKKIIGFQSCQRSQ